MEGMQSRVEEIPTRAIQGNRFLAISVGGGELERCEKAIKQYGIIHPPVVRKFEGRYQVLEGECERMVLARMHRSKTPAVVVEGLEEPVEATRLTLLLCALKRSPTALSEGLLLKELCHGGHHSQTEAASLVGRSVSWVNKRLSMAERLAASVVDLVQSGRLCPYAAQEIAKMPEDVQQAFATKVISENLATSVVERLVSTYNRPGAPREVMRAVLDDPRTVLGSLTDAQRARSRKNKENMDPRVISLEKLRSILNMLFRLAGEAAGLLAGMPAEDKQALKPVLRQCVTELQRFCRLITTCQDTEFSVQKNPAEELRAHDH